MPSSEAATRIFTCVVAGQGYQRCQPVIESVSEPEAVMVDGVFAHKVVGRVRVSYPSLSVSGDVITVVVIDSAPQSCFQPDTRFGDSARAVIAQQVLDQVKVAREV